MNDRKVCIDIAKTLTIAQKRGCTWQLLVHVLPSSPFTKSLENGTRDGQVMLSMGDAEKICRRLTDGPQVVTIDMISHASN